MKDLILGIGEMGVSDTPGSMIKTFALGSCIALILYEPRKRIGGMVHIALSNSNINEEKSRTKPGYFVDTALPALIAMMKKKIKSEDLSSVIVKLAGGASVMEDARLFNIGGNNISEVKKLLHKYGLNIKAEDTGGDLSRTVTLFIDTGKTLISNYKKGKWEL